MKPLFITLMTLFTVVSNGLTQELVTDRPDFTESAVVVPARMIQVESGVEAVDLGFLEELSYPNALARIGVGHNLELRVGVSGWTRISTDDRTETYLNDVLLEAKYQFTDANARIPVALLLVSTLPTGDDEVSVGEAEVGVKLASAADLNHRLSIGVNANLISTTSGKDRELLSQASVALGIGITDRLGGFAEVYTDIPPNDPWQPVVDGGVTVLLTPLLQLDLYAGAGLNDHAPELILGGGLSFRIGY
jgi:hypothetical protein